MNDFNLKNIKSEFKNKGIFYTPHELGEYLKSLIDIEYDEVYDPTCGHGSLLSVFPDNVKKYGQEINDFALNSAKESLVNFIGEIGDTIQEDKFKGKKFKTIVANPPFSIKYELTENLKTDERFREMPVFAPESKADYMFIFHILAKLKDNGVAVVLNFPGIAYRKNREKDLRQYLIEKNYIDTVIHVEGNKFTDTKIATLVFILRKNKKTKDIRMIDSENELERFVNFEEIRENDFNLSISTYLAKEEEKEEIDETLLNDEIEQVEFENFKKGLRTDLFLKMEFGAKIDIEGKIKRRKKFLRDFEKEFMEAEKTGIIRYKAEELKLF